MKERTKANSKAIAEGEWKKQRSDEKRCERCLRHARGKIVTPSMYSLSMRLATRKSNVSVGGREKVKKEGTIRKHEQQCEWTKKEDDEKMVRVLSETHGYAVANWIRVLAVDGVADALLEVAREKREKTEK